MGGANVASTNDMAAQYYNPAAFGFFGKKHKTTDGTRKRYNSDNNHVGRKDWGVDLNAGAGYRLHNEFGKYLDDLSDIDHDLLSTTGIQNQSDLEKIIKLANGVDGLDDPGNAVTANINGGLGFRIQHFGLGVHGYFQAAGRALYVDTTNLGISTNTADVDTDINAVTMPADYTVYTPQVFNATQQAQLTAAGLSSEAINRLDYFAWREGLTTTSADGTVDILTNISNQSGTSTLDNNTTTALLNGFGVAEIPVTYGYAFNEHIAVGTNLKLMRGRVYGNQIVVFDNDAEDTIEKSDEFYEETTTFGIDVGIMARLPKFNIGLVGRNLNSPKFDGPTVTFASGTVVKFDDVRIEPQAAFGVAFIPLETLTIEADIDLTENKTILPGYDTQNVSAGLEWDAFRFLALRVGAYKNLAESDIGWVYTAGLGINLWAVRLDVAGAMSSTTEEYDDDDIPREAKAVFRLAADF